jgi:hypothetical protein
VVTFLLNFSALVFIFLLFFRRITPFTPKSGLLCSAKFCFDDHGSFVVFSIGFSPTQTSHRSNFDHDYFFKLPLQGAGCPFTIAVCYFPPCLVPSCPAYEPNSNEGEYSQPFRHIQYNRIPILRPIATLAMLLCRRIARWMYRRRQCGLKRVAACAASTNK